MKNTVFSKVAQERHSRIPARTAPLEAEEVQEELCRILSSPGFIHNQRLSSFLRFVVERQLEGKAGQLKETVIAMQVLGRKPDYDPKLDPIVRTEAARLRTRLARYYAGEGAADRIAIDIPKGGYVPVIHSNDVDLNRPAVEPLKRAGRSWLRMGVAAGVIAFVAASWWWLANRKLELPVIAVLPFENLSADPDNQFFVDGLTDEIIGNLSLIKGLEVRSRTSSFSFKGKPRNLRELGVQLGANVVLEGSVQRAGGNLRINARLIKVAGDVPLWAARFDRELKDVFIVQDEISRAIVNALRLTGVGGQRRYDANVEAYDLYLKGRTLLWQTPPAAEESRIWLLKAVMKDPTFAPAYAGIAESYEAMTRSVDLPSEEAYLKMHEAAEKALELDPLLPEAHAIMGLVHSREGDWQDAEKDFRRAIELNPNYSRPYIYLAWWVLVPTGRMNEAFAAQEKAVKADPLSPYSNNVRPWLEFISGRYDEAIANFRRLLLKTPHELISERGLALALLQQGRSGEAIWLLQKHPHLNTGYLGYAYGITGRRAEAEVLAAGNTHRPHQLLHIYAGLRDKDRVFDTLETMVAKKDPRVGVFLTYPGLALIREDPRMAAFRRKAGLP